MDFEWHNDLDDVCFHNSTHTAFTLMIQEYSCELFVVLEQEKITGGLAERMPSSRYAWPSEISLDMPLVHTVAGIRSYPSP